MRKTTPPKPLNRIGELYENADSAPQRHFKAAILDNWDNWRKTWRYAELDKVPTAITVAAVYYLKYPNPILTQSKPFQPQHQ